MRQAAIQSGGQPPILLLTYSSACQNMTMAAFAEAMRSMAGAQQYFDSGGSLTPLPKSAAAVVDQTGLSGNGTSFSNTAGNRPPPPRLR
jgi:hypothetical protein